jgi:uncharacterized membrane protein
MKKLSNIFLALLVSMPAFAQEMEVEMADKLRADGKIYVLVAIILVILLGLLIYVTIIDRKVSGLEKRLDQNKRP